jgi:hypothetical protein
MIRPWLHIALHFIVPGLAARWVAPQRFWAAFGVMSATILIDLDHLLASPVYDPDRCSIGFHPLHTWPAWLVYLCLLYPRKTRWLGCGLCIHMLLDALDCAMVRGGLDF